MGIEEAACGQTNGEEENLSLWTSSGTKKTRTRNIYVFAGTSLGVVLDKEVIEERGNEWK